MTISVIQTKHVKQMVADLCLAIGCPNWLFLSDEYVQISYINIPLHKEGNIYDDDIDHILLSESWIKNEIVDIFSDDDVIKDCAWKYW